MAKSASRAAASNRLVTEGWKEGWMDRQMDIESRHVMCVILALSSAHACTQGNVSHRQSDIGTEVFLLFLFIECHTEGFSRISLSLLLSVCLLLSVTLSCLLPSTLPVNSQLIFLLTRTVMHFCFLNVLALPLLPPALRVLPYLSFPPSPSGKNLSH